MKKLKAICESVGITVTGKDTEATLLKKINEKKAEMKFKPEYETGENPNVSITCKESISRINICILLEMLEDAVKYFSFAMKFSGNAEQRQELFELQKVLTSLHKWPEQEASKDETKAEEGTDQANEENNSEAETKSEAMQEEESIMNNSEMPNAKQRAGEYIKFLDGKDMELKFIRFGLEVSKELLRLYQIQERKKNKPAGRFRMAERAIDGVIKKQLR